MKGVLVVGTDTDCGKTEVSLGLIAALKNGGHSVLGMKPVASGCDRTPDGLRSRDAVRLASEGSLAVPYDTINPYAFEPPIAPHIAAEQAGVAIDPEVIRARAQCLADAADFVVVEGVGGWLVPLGPELAVSDLSLLLDLPVLLVVGLRLGCISHSLLTAECIESRGCGLLGWVADQVDPAFAARDENLSAIEARIGAPCLGVVPWLSPPLPAQVARHLIVDRVTRGTERVGAIASAINSVLQSTAGASGQ